jgi:hypothetical protein
MSRIIEAFTRSHCEASAIDDIIMALVVIVPFVVLYLLVYWWLGKE